MPFIEVNQAQIFYEIFGDQRAGQVPVVLIHGSTMTGQSDLGLAAALLARHYPVILPDCRGHGQSSNPLRSYSFKELAADVAGLIGSLGYPRAHIIGHSNGGNVALVTLCEHPDIVQSAVLQAANAFVSQDLIEKEPSIFDPDRVAREAPQWRDKMIALHGSTHGADYWRDLLLLTGKEIIREPNYTPEDLKRVMRPTLVIQGEKDMVNAPSRHAQFIAEHIPDAELWIPSAVSHSVHLERPFEWVERIEDFLERRGDAANDALYRLRRQRYADERETVFAVRAAMLTNRDGSSSERLLKLSGKVLSPQQVSGIQDQIRNIPDPPIAVDSSELAVLLQADTSWALIKRNVTDVRREPHSLAERLTQALMGESLRILEQNGEWAFVRLERDGYLGWVQLAAIHPVTAGQAKDYQRSFEVLVTASLAQAARLPGETSPAAIAGWLPFGLRLPTSKQHDGYTAVHLPDGTLWWLASSDLLPLSRQPHPDAQGIQFTLELIRRFTGVPYLWGGRSPYGFDCSGLVQTFASFMGIQIPRDADQQFRAAAPVTGIPQPGDLLFFGSQDESAGRPVTHVAISLGGDDLIHANGTAGGVSDNSLNPTAATYRAWLRENLAGVGRFWQ